MDKERRYALGAARVWKENPDLLLFSFFHIFVVVILTALLGLFSSKVLTGPKTLWSSIEFEDKTKVLPCLPMSG